MRRNQIIIFLIVLVSFVVSAYFYPQMPDKMASHWNIKGEVDGYLPKSWGLLLLPLISLLAALLLILFPKIDPLKENIEKFRKYFGVFIILILIFLLYIHLLTIFWSRGLRFEIFKFLAPAFGVLFYYCGVLVENAKRNWFIGIRTPWTLSSDRVWEKTHRIGGRLFKAAGVIAFLGVFLPAYGFFLVIIPVILAAIYPTVYSYFIHRKNV